jgi:glyoxylase-like metal-dependent hydrolase (beta-lactamase superfamily II)
VIIRKLEVGAFAANCFLVADEASKEGMVIDPGAEGGVILKAIKSLGLKIKYIVLTHSHMDHIGAVGEVKEGTGAKLAIHEDEAEMLKRPPFRMMMPLSRTPPPADILLKEGDTIALGKLKFKVLHTPGHTPGGICLYTEGIVFSGDTLFNFGIGRADFPGASYDQELESIKGKLMTLPDNTVVCPGHGPDTTIGIERQGNPFLHGEI